MKPTNWRERYFYECGRAGLTERFARDVLRWSHAVQRGAEANCSLQDAEPWMKRGNAAGARIVALCARETALRLEANPRLATVRAEFQGDPRGATVRIIVGGPNGAVGRDIPVPSEGFSGDAIERLVRAQERAKAVPAS